MLDISGSWRSRGRVRLGLDLLGLRTAAVSVNRASRSHPLWEKKEGSSHIHTPGHFLLSITHAFLFIVLFEIIVSPSLAPSHFHFTHAWSRNYALRNFKNSCFPRSILRLPLCRLTEIPPRLRLLPGSGVQIHPR